MTWEELAKSIKAEVLDLIEKHKALQDRHIEVLKERNELQVNYALLIKQYNLLLGAWNEAREFLKTEGERAIERGDPVN